MNKNIILYPTALLFAIVGLTAMIKGNILLLIASFSVTFLITVCVFAISRGKKWS